jgi:hypothetical protein
MLAAAPGSMHALVALAVNVSHIEERLDHMIVAHLRIVAVHA